MCTHYRLTTILFFTLISFAAQAQNLDLPAEKDAPARPLAKSATQLPLRGLSMAYVEQHFGAPVQKHSPVGSPPITRWIYPGYVVYFEHTHVIQTVPSNN